MPKLQRYRFWCYHCNEYTIQTKTHCTICDTESKTYKLSDVPKSKLFEQRKRYNKAISSQTLQIINMLAFNYEMLDLYTHAPQYDIIENDAGQKAINEKRKKESEDEWNKKQIEKQRKYDLYKRFKNLGRNAKCFCGNDKKFKNCCLDKIK